MPYPLPPSPQALEKKLEFLKREEEIIKEEAVAAKAAAVVEEAKDKAVAAAAAAAAAAAVPPLTATEALGATAAMAAQAADARAAAAAAAAAAAQAGGAGAAAAAGGPVGLPEAAKATAAALLGGALHPELAQALTVEALSEEERAAKVGSAGVGGCGGTWPVWVLLARRGMGGPRHVQRRRRFLGISVQLCRTPCTHQRRRGDFPPWEPELCWLPVYAAKLFEYYTCTSYSASGHRRRPPPARLACRPSWRRCCR